MHKPDDFKKMAEKWIGDWQSDLKKSLAKTKVTLAEIERLQKLSTLGAEDKKKLGAALSHRDAMRKAAIASTEGMLMRLKRSKVDPSDAEALTKLDGWLGNSLKLGAVAFTENIGIVPPKSMLNKKSGEVMLPDIKIRF
jgi:hypothetical protein